MNEEIFDIINKYIKLNEEELLSLKLRYKLLKDLTK